MQTTLDMLPVGARARIAGFTRGGGWMYRLYQMGFTPGAIIEVVANHGRGPIIVRIMGVEVAVGRGIARRILVQPL
ncbi:FeoA family protein [Staphylothermus hellenicus]|uniref:FeoA family protein n=1 Tax=Staphylothermus hellenicus (strain DSM 12710 / JCM 10830 / BK20S6-10-b1 / P8) TaxID=591019 RepID=D7D841_STAHD|nr:FeoA family protein [Staphylothermus hellenicus]ADI31937.1 FeoA family protein [Staphylothermus hellenicus DSM 12710]